MLAWFFNYKSNIEPLDETPEIQSVQIESGLAASEIATLLENEDIIKSASAFNIYLRLNGARDSLQAGNYELSASLSVAEIVDILTSGKVKVKSILIPPGLTVKDIKDIFIESGYSPSEVEFAFSNVSPKDYIAGVNADNLEGYISPNTYTLGADLSAEDLLILTLEEFEKQLTPELLAGFEKQGLSVNGATILASITQLESSLPENQEKIAQVFIRRINENIPLGADPTFRYASEQLGVADDINVDSPYNTRINAGFPPTPIANFNLSALQAVSDPADTNFLFFVSGDDSTTYFSNTLSEHESLTEQYCVELCQL